MHYTTKDQTLGIQCSNGILTFKDSRGTLRVLKEQPLDKFEQFYRLWQSALEVSEDMDFVNNWVHNPEFRALITQALEAIGIDNPEQLSPSLMSALLVSYEDPEKGEQDGTGLIFNLHYCFPKSLRSKILNKNLQISLTVLMSWILSLLEGLTPSQNLAKMALVVTRLILSCGVYTSRFLAITLTIPKNLSQLNLNDGKSKSEKPH